MAYAFAVKRLLKALNFHLDSEINMHTLTCAQTHLDVISNQSHCCKIEHSLFQSLSMSEPVLCLQLTCTKPLWQEHLVSIILRMPSALSSPWGNNTCKAMMFCPEPSLVEISKTNWSSLVWEESLRIVKIFPNQIQRMPVLKIWEGDLVQHPSLQMEKQAQKGEDSPQVDHAASFWLEQSWP